MLVDVSIDQGGCFETSHPTTHSEPTYEVDGITHYCVANMPGAVPITSTFALTNATMPYVVKLADRRARRPRWPPTRVPPPGSTSPPAGSPTRPSADEQAWSCAPEEALAACPPPPEAPTCRSVLVTPRSSRA